MPIKIFQHHNKDLLEEEVNLFVTQNDILIDSIKVCTNMNDEDVIYTTIVVDYDLGEKGI